MSMTKRLDGRTYSADDQDTSWTTDICTDGWDTLCIQVIQEETVSSLDVDWDLEVSDDGENWVATSLNSNPTGDASDTFLDLDVTPRYYRIIATVNSGTGDLSFKVNAKGSAD